MKNKKESSEISEQQETKVNPANLVMVQAIMQPFQVFHFKVFNDVFELEKFVAKKVSLARDTQGNACISLGKNLLVKENTYVFNNFGHISLYTEEQLKESYKILVKE